jgi:Domain of Unknown Function (DUF1206)
MAQNGVFERCARDGYVVSGLLHLTIGYLAIRIALGSRGGGAVGLVHCDAELFAV